MFFRAKSIFLLFRKKTLGILQWLATVTCMKNHGKIKKIKQKYKMILKTSWRSQMACFLGLNPDSYYLEKKQQKYLLSILATVRCMKRIEKLKKIDS